MVMLCVLVLNLNFVHIHTPYQMHLCVCVCVCMHVQLGRVGLAVMVFDAGLFCLQPFESSLFPSQWIQLQAGRRQHFVVLPEIETVQCIFAAGSLLKCKNKHFPVLSPD